MLTTGLPSDMKVKAAQLCPTLCNPKWDSPGQNTGVSSHSLLQGIFPTQVSHIAGRFFTSQATREEGKPKNTGVGSLSLLQQIFPTQELNRGLWHCRRILYQLSYQGSHDALLLQITVLFVIVPNWKQCRCPSISQQSHKLWYIHTTQQYRERNELLTTWMNLQRIILKKVNSKSLHFI